MDGSAMKIAWIIEGTALASTLSWNTRQTPTVKYSRKPAELWMIKLLFREELFELAIKVSDVVKGWSSLDKIKLLSFSKHYHFFSHAQPMLCCKFQQTHWRFPTRHDFVQPSQLFVSFPVKMSCCQLRRQVAPFITMFTLHHHVAIKSHKRIEKRVGLFGN